MSRLILALFEILLIGIEICLIIDQYTTRLNRIDQCIDGRDMIHHANNDTVYASRIDTGHRYSEERSDMKQ